MQRLCSISRLIAGVFMIAVNAAIASVAQAQTTTCFDPVAFGAKPNDRVDDRAAIQAAVDAAIAAHASVCFGPGNWELTRSPVLGTANIGSIRVAGANGLVIRGVGPSTRLRMKGSAGPNGTSDWRLIDVREGSTNVTIRDLTLDGSLRGQTPEQTHLLHLTGPVSRITAERVWFDLPQYPAPRTAGDCIRLLGESAAEVTDVTLRRVVGLRCDRSFVGFQRAVRRVRIEAATSFEVGDQAIDFEPTGGVGIFAVTIINSHFARGPGAQGPYTIALGGDGHNVADRISISSTFVQDGGVHVIDTRNVTLDDVHIRGALNSAAPVLHIRKRAQNVRVLNSTVVRPANALAGEVVSIHHQSGQSPTDVSIINSVLMQGKSAPVMSVESLNKLVLANSTLRYSGAAGAIPAITARGVIAPLSRVEVRNNRFDGLAQGALSVSLYSPSLPIGQVIVTGNMADQLTQYGVKFQNGLPSVPPIITQNNFGAVAPVIP
jgi:hypothetical protein